ncbi:hypothetical protein IFM89_003876 [Coptis chinensis]|uniref:F-box associated beta-propeller type 3 domain-containing protein n=1 Tax=Coptis chinensis TaxID=261450 RepID=A0A835I034_9MAGN|nr:hypothetical protein IFM89_003876 [Coptis chinensis]
MVSSQFPVEVVIEILSRVPLKYLCQFRARTQYSIVGISNGLVCLRGEILLSKFYLWNPLTKDHITIPCPPIPSHFVPHNTTTEFGFGFHQVSNEYKVIRIACSHRDYGYLEDHFQSHFSVYTLGGPVMWRTLEDESCIGNSVVKPSIALVNGALYWFAAKPGNLFTWNVIVSFDIKDEVFQEIPRPNDVDFHDSFNRIERIGELGGFLSIFCVLRQVVVEVWVMIEHGSWTKQFNVGRPNGASPRQGLSVESINEESFQSLNFALVAMKNDIFLISSKAMQYDAPDSIYLRQGMLCLTNYVQVDVNLSDFDEHASPAIGKFYSSTAIHMEPSMERPHYHPMSTCQSCFVTSDDEMSTIIGFSSDQATNDYKNHTVSLFSCFIYLSVESVTKYVQVLFSSAWNAGNYAELDEDNQIHFVGHSAGVKGQSLVTTHAGRQGFLRPEDGKSLKPIWLLQLDRFFHLPEQHGIDDQKVWCPDSKGRRHCLEVHAQLCCYKCKVAEQGHENCFSLLLRDEFHSIQTVIGKAKGSSTIIKHMWGAAIVGGMEDHSNPMQMSDEKSHSELFLDDYWLHE